MHLGHLIKLFSLTDYSHDNRYIPLVHTLVPIGGENGILWVLRSTQRTRTPLVRGHVPRADARSMGERMEWRKGTLLALCSLLGCLGGAMAIAESGFVLAYSSGSVGAVGLMVATASLSGALLFHWGRRYVGALVMLLSSLVGQITGGVIGLFLSVVLSPPPLPLFNLAFGVSRWTLLCLLGGVLGLSIIRKDGSVK